MRSDSERGDVMPAVHFARRRGYGRSDVERARAYRRRLRHLRTCYDGGMLPLEASGAPVATSAPAGSVQVATAPSVPWLTWSERLRVPAGHPLAGQPLDLAWIAPMFELAGDRVVITVARKNGKTTAVVAYMLHSMLYGPHGWRGLVASIRRENAAEARIIADGLIQANGLAPYFRVTSDRIVGPRGECAISSSHTGAGHSAGLNFAVFDEAGLAADRYNDTVSALDTALTGRDGRLFVTSVRGRSPVMERVLSDQTAVIVQHEAPMGAEVTDESAWHLANPTLGAAKSLARMRRDAHRASLSPIEEGTFRTFELNQPGKPSDTSPSALLSPEQWRGCQRMEPPRAVGPCFLGIDLGGSWSLTSAAAYWPESGLLRVLNGLPGGVPLEKRGRQDGDARMYTVSVDRGFSRGLRSRAADGYSGLPRCGVCGCVRRSRGRAADGGGPSQVG